MPNIIENPSFYAKNKLFLKGTVLDVKFCIFWEEEDG